MHIWARHDQLRPKRRIRLWLTLALVLTGCALDEEEDVRALMRNWVFLAQTQHFVSQIRCTVAVFDVVSPDLRVTGARKVDSVGGALTLLNRGHAVAFVMPGLTPSEISQQLMSLSLPNGLGMITAVTGPARECMEEAVEIGVYLALTSPDSVMVYDPANDAVMLLYGPGQLAFFIKGNV